MAIRVQTFGTQNLIRTLSIAMIDVQRLKEANKRAAQVVAAASEGLAPKRSGRLARSSRAGATQKAGVIRIGNNTTTPYANPIHWGWPSRNIAANPWASRAAQATETLWVREYNQYVDEVLGRIRGI